MPYAPIEPSGASAITVSRSKSNRTAAQAGLELIARLVDEPDVGHVTSLEELDQGVEAAAPRRRARYGSGKVTRRRAFFRAGPLATLFFAALFFAVDFFGALFLAVDFFFGGSTAPSSPGLLLRGCDARLQRLHEVDDLRGGFGLDDLDLLPSDSPRRSSAAPHGTRR